jgi:MFS family permease
MTTNNTAPKYRWFILALGVITHIFAWSLSLFSIPVLFPEISRDLNLNLVQIGVIWGMSFLPTIFISLFGGMLGDRFGVVKVMVISCILLGIAGALRGFANSYSTLLIYTLIFGFVGTPITVMTHKAAAQWFSGKELGLANGILAMGIGVGGILGVLGSATVMSPLLGGWRHVLFLYAGISVIIGLLWLLTVKHHNPNTTQAYSIETVPLKQALWRVLGLKQVWLMAFIQLCFSAGRGGLSGYLPTYLEGLGWSTLSADGAVSAISIASVVGVIPLSLLSDRLGSRKKILLPAMILTVLSIGLLAITQNVLMIWLLLIVIGLFQEAVAAVRITMTMEMQGVGMVYAGTAMGLTSMIGSAGNLFGPPLGNKFASILPAYGFVFWCAMGVLSVIIAFLIKDTGWKVKKS